MPGWLKALLIVAAVIVLLVLGTIGAGVYWWAKNKDALLARGKEVMTEGRDFGRQSDNQGCVDESIVRYKKEQGFLSAVSATRFMRGCFESSRPTPGFCDNVPLGDMMKMAEWRDAQCRRYDLANDRNCKSQLFTPVAMFCGEQKRKEN